MGGALVTIHFFMTHKDGFSQQEAGSCGVDVRSTSVWVMACERASRRAKAEWLGGKGKNTTEAQLRSRVLSG